MFLAYTKKRNIILMGLLPFALSRGQVGMEAELDPRNIFTAGVSSQAAGCAHLCSAGCLCFGRTLN